MFPISILEGKAKIEFSRDFYDMYPITEVCERFEDIAKIELCFIPEANKIEITISPKAEIGLNKLSLEFINHCLHEQVMISR